MASSVYRKGSGEARIEVDCWDWYVHQGLQWCLDYWYSIGEGSMANRVRTAMREASSSI